jgi:hypothetical protein
MAMIQFDTAECPHCGTRNSLAALKCQHCGVWLSAKPEPITQTYGPPLPDPHERRQMPHLRPFLRRHLWWMLLLAFALGALRQPVLQFLRDEDAEIRARAETLQTIEQ